MGEVFLPPTMESVLATLRRTSPKSSPEIRLGDFLPGGILGTNIELGLTPTIPSAGSVLEKTGSRDLDRGERLAALPPLLPPG